MAITVHPSRPLRLELGLLAGVTAVLLGVGLALVASGAATPAAGRWGKAPAEYVARQLLCALLGSLAAGGCFLAGRERLLRLSTPLAAALLGLCAITLVPGLGVRFGGASRQVALLGVLIQPTILLIGVLPLLVAARLGSGPTARRDPLPYLVAVLCGLICLGQPNFGHLGTLLATLLGALAGLGARRALRVVGGVGLLCGPLALSFPYVRWRVASFLSPGLTRDTTALQEIASSAGPFGLGLGQGVDKALLSAAPTDYMFATVLEELGWIGGIGLGALIVAAAALAWRLAPRDDLALRAAAGGTAAFVLFPAAIHVAVCLRLFPVTGIHLPFLSYSGSSVLAVALALGALTGLARGRPTVGDTIPGPEAGHEREQTAERGPLRTDHHDA